MEEAPSATQNQVFKNSQRKRKQENHLAQKGRNIYKQEMRNTYGKKMIKDLENQQPKTYNMQNRSKLNPNPNNKGRESKYGKENKTIKIHQSMDNS